MSKKDTTREDVAEQKRNAAVKKKARLAHNHDMVDIDEYEDKISGSDLKRLYKDE